MAQYELTGPDGGVYHVSAPDGASQQEVLAYATGKPIPKTDTNPIRAFGLGVSKPIDNIANALSGLPVIGDWLGNAAAKNQLMRDRNSRTGYQMAGNILGTLPTAAIPGGPLVQGAVSGGLLTDKKDAYGVTGDMAGGAITSKLGGMLINGLGSTIAPTVTKGQRALYDMGVRFTPGQLGSMAATPFGKGVAGFESAMQRLPGAKQVIGAAQNRGQEAYYKGVLKRTGIDLPDNIPLGHDAHDFIGKSLSREYQKLLPNLQVSADAKLATGLAQTQADLQSRIPADQFKLFTNTLKSVNLRKTGGLNIDGRTYQQAEQTLRSMADDYWRAYARSRNPTDKYMAEGYSSVLDQMRGVLMRQNPKYAPQLSTLNKRWRELALVRKAAGDENATTGVFTPAQYSRAAKGGKSNASTTRTANQYLTNRSPDSGTSESVAMGYMGIAGSGAAGGLVAPLAGVNPVIPPLLAATSTAYTKPGQEVLNRFVFAPRGPVAQAVGSGTRAVGRVAPAIVPPLLYSRDR